MIYLNAPDWCFSNSVSFMINRFGHIEMDYIGKCENYANDLNYICEKIKIPFIKIKSEKEKMLRITNIIPSITMIKLGKR